MSKTEYIRTAVIHPKVEHSEFGKNCNEILKLNKEACSHGAKIIVNTEMGLSGYSFQSIEELENLTINENSDIFRKFSALSAKHENYICLGAAYRDKSSNIIYNSAIVFGPEGTAVLKYNKVIGEFRWACCGDADQENTFETPWGKVGVLICADSYFSLLARATVLRGARMLLVPTNWPNMGMDPAEVWRARAVENGVYLLAANRAGDDRTMNFDNAASAIIDNNGRFLVNDMSEVSMIKYSDVEISDGMIVNTPSAIEGRTPSKYSNIYLNLKGVASLKDHFELPESGNVSAYACSFVPVEDDIEELSLSIGDCNANRIVVLPESSYDMGRMKKLSEETSCGLVLRNNSEGNVKWHVFDSGKELEIDPEKPELICSSAKVALVDSHELYHPERFYHFAKSGCDMAILCGAEKIDNMDILSGIRATENLAVAVAFNDYASVASPPSAHSRWQQDESEGRGYAMDVFDTEQLRKKRLYHDFDYELLLNGGSKDV